MPTLQRRNSARFQNRYSAKSVCSPGPMWSGERFVNTPTANSMPATRSNFSPRLDTSMTQVSQPSSAIWRKSACNSQLSGVVWFKSCRCPGQRTPFVPTSPTRRPSACKMAASRCAVVVLPFVPVMPIIVIRLAGSPYSRAESTAIVRRGSSASRTAMLSGTVTSCPASTATAPAAAACAAKSAPSACCPGRQTKSAPGAAQRESQQTDVTSVRASPRKSRQPVFWISRRKSICHHAPKNCSYQIKKL